jgi:hypothetical protein
MVIPINGHFPTAGHQDSRRRTERRVVAGGTYMTRRFEAEGKLGGHYQIVDGHKRHGCRR